MGWIGVYWYRGYGVSSASFLKQLLNAGAMMRSMRDFNVSITEVWNVVSVPSHSIVSMSLILIS